MKLVMRLTTSLLLCLIGTVILHGRPSHGDVVMSIEPSRNNISQTILSMSGSLAISESRGFQSVPAGLPPGNTFQFGSEEFARGLGTFFVLLNENKAMNAFDVEVKPLSLACVVFDSSDSEGPNYATLFVLATPSNEEDDAIAMLSGPFVNNTNFSLAISAEPESETTLAGSYTLEASLDDLPLAIGETCTYQVGDQFVNILVQDPTESPTIEATESPTKSPTIEATESPTKSPSLAPVGGPCILRCDKFFLVCWWKLLLCWLVSLFSSF